MSTPVRTIDLTELLAAGIPLIDVRAPAEFAQGAVPGAVNLPILTDAERHQVGLAYKQSGPAEAVATGETLVSGTARAARLNAWMGFAERHPDTWLYCWRGGLRSQIAQRWLRECGADVARVPGGFKALRQTCLALLERAPKEKSWLILGGRTGSGKTRVIRERREAIDLEGIANHRGSAFGAQPGGQPNPVDFENRLAVAFLRHTPRLLLLEDESRTIGRLALPEAWHRHMQQTPLLIMETDLSERVHNIRQEYVRDPLAAGAPASELHRHYQSAVDRIRRRLGGLRHREVSDALSMGFANDSHDQWIERLLIWYYDPMYDYQLAAKQERVVVRGNAQALHAYLDDLVS